MYYSLFLVLALALVSFDSMVFAEEVLEQDRICSSQEALTLMGTEGWCSPLFFPQSKREKSGICSGKLGTMDCSIGYNLYPDYGTLEVKCGLIDQDMIPALHRSHKIGALIKDGNGKKFLIGRFDVEYTSVSSSLGTIFFLEEKGKAQGHKIELFIGETGVPLESVNCW